MGTKDVSSGGIRHQALKRSLVLAALLLAGPGHAQTLMAPIPSPYGQSSFVGSVRVTFDQGLLQGRIFYTLDGSTPTSRSTQYTNAFTIDTTTVLKAVRIRGNNASPVTEVTFVQRRLPKPGIVFDGKPEFTGTKTVTLSVEADIPSNAPNARTAPRIVYTTDGGAPDSLYAGKPLTLTRSGLLVAVATHPDFESSDPASQQFTLLAPVAAPRISPPGQPFTTRSLQVTFSTATPSAYFQYSLGPDGNPATAGMVSTDGTATLVGGNPGDTLILRVVAMKSGMANSPVVEERYVYQPPAAKPEASPPPTFFHDTLTVSLSSATPGAAIHYTLNGNLPTANTPLYEGPIRIDSTVTLRAIAFREGGHPSEVFSGQYALRLSPPVADPPGREFTDILTVRLESASPGARILYTLDGNDPTRSSPALDPDGAVTLSMEGVTVLKTICVKGDVESPVAAYVYTRRQVVTTTPEPSILPPGRDFLDSLTVEIRTQDPSAAIRYTLDGSTPTAASPLYAGPVRLRESATLQAYAQSPGLLPSAVRSETYVVVPSPPVADPPATLPIPNRGEVRLSARTPGATIYYVLDDQPFTWEAVDAGIAREYKSPIIFVADTRIRAVAVAGTGDARRMSQVMDQSYTIYAGNPDDTLAAGQTRAFSGGFLLANKGPAPASVRLAGFNDLDLDGFLSPTLSVTVAAAPGQAFPAMEFSRPEGSEHAVYRMGLSGRPEFVGAAGAVSIAKAGTYFAAVDTAVPVISLLPVQPKEGGPVTVQLYVEDNVDGIVCDVTGTGIAAAAVQAGPDGLHTFTLAASGADLGSLWFRARAGDGRNEALFPADPSGRYVVPRAWSGFSTPAAWMLGRPGQPYDLAGLPVRGNGNALTWGQVREDNPDPSLTAWIWRDGGYFPLTDADVLSPGTGFWLGGPESRNSLTFSRFQSSETDRDGRYRILLKPGWNLVANPSLDRMYWPAARSDRANYVRSRVFGLWRYDADIDDYAASDSLEAWKGYWVWNDLARDTSVALSPVPPPAGMNAKSAAPAADGPAARPEVELLLDYGRSLPLRLGAKAHGRDEVGLEDEPQLPGWLGRREAWSARERSRLMTDVLRFEPAGVLRWKLVLQGAPAPGRDSLVKVIGSRLPPAFEAWAWLPARNLKVRLEDRAALSLPGNGPDTLHVFAGPASKLASMTELSRAVEGVAAFEASLRMGRRGPDLRLALPTDAAVEAALWSPAGRRLARVFSGRLGTGVHALPIRAEKAAGAAFLRIRVKGHGLDVHRVLKYAW